MTEQQTQNTMPEAITQGIQQANIESLEKTDPMEAGLQQPVQISGVADKTQKIMGEKVDPVQQVIQKPAETPTFTAPVAAPIQQIAPVSANGEKTSSRESMKADAPAEIVQASQTGENTVPSAAESANPSVPPVTSQPEAPSEPEQSNEVPFDQQDPLQQANGLLRQIPGRFRLYQVIEMPFKSEKQKKAFFAKRSKNKSGLKSGNSNLQQHTADNLPEIPQSTWNVIFQSNDYDSLKKAKLEAERRNVEDIKNSEAVTAHLRDDKQTSLFPHIKKPRYF